MPERIQSVLLGVAESQFPVVLYGKPELYEYVPHFPLMQIQDGRFAVPIGNAPDPEWSKPGVLVFRSGKNHNLYSFEFSEAARDKSAKTRYDLPSSVGDTRMLGRILGFVLDEREPVFSKSVRAFGVDGSELPLDGVQSSNLRGFLISSKNKARTRTAAYHAGSDS